ncbi:MAG: PAS domain-containing protein [Methylotenera sp.]|nr:PAS domain-containing protein [Methylotenera sp.]
MTTNSLGNILYVHGDTSRFMRQPAGVITTNLLDMARDGLQIALRAALQAAKHGTPTLEQEVSIKTDSGLLMLRFSVRILTSANPEAKAVDRLLLVSFQEVAEIAKPKRRTSGKDISSADNATRIEQLQRELTYSRESLQATIERQQATNEELKSSNEELQSSNEELQSTNEELDTAKEEMQSLNEETLTVNSELSNKIELSSNLQNDMKNLMDNVNVGIIFLDYQLNIRSYTREALKICHFIAADVGRPLGDITFNLQGDSNLLDELHAVLETLVPYEREVQSTEGVWYLARIQPYRTLDNVIDGIVLTFTNIDLIRNLTLKLANVELTKQLSEGIVNTIVEPLVVLNADLQVISASRAFYQYFKVLQEQTVGKKIYDLGNGQWNIPSLRKLLDEILPQQITIENFVVEHNFPELGPQRMMLNARRIKTVMGDTELILLAIMDLKRTD